MFVVYLDDAISLEISQPIDGTLLIWFRTTWVRRPIFLQSYQVEARVEKIKTEHFLRLFISIATYLHNKEYKNDLRLTS